MPSIELVLKGYSVRTNEGTLGFCSVALVRGERTYLVDVAQPARRSHLLEALRTMGMTPNDIDAVFLTHSHWDHMLNIDLFQNAEVIIHRLELEYVRNPLPGDNTTPLYTKQLLEDKRLRVVEDGDRLEPGISALLTSGHTRGSMTMLVDTGEGIAGIVGDAMPSARAYLEGVPSIMIWSEQEARDSIKRIAAHTNLIYPGHDRPFRITEGGTEYLGPLSITFSTMIEPGRENVTVTLGGTPPPAPIIFPR